MNKIYFLMILFSVNAFSFSLDPDILNKSEEKYIQTKIKKKKVFFKLGIVGSKFIVKNRLKSELITDGTNDTTGLGYEFGIGFNWYKFATGIYLQKNSLSNVNLLNLSLGTDYFLTDKVYVGGILGQSFLTWKKSPVKNTIKKKEQQRNGYFGMQLGTQFAINHELSFYTQYQLLLLNQATSINTDDNLIEHKIQNSINIGVKYGF